VCVTIAEWSLMSVVDRQHLNIKRNTSKELVRLSHGSAKIGVW
jgi:hypothetical protein